MKNRTESVSGNRKSSKAKLAAGAAEIREAERELAPAQPVKLDGTLSSATREIIRLHGEILSAF
jgi:hypothetical protein